MKSNTYQLVRKILKNELKDFTRDERKKLINTLQDSLCGQSIVTNSNRIVTVNYDMDTTKVFTSKKVGVRRQNLISNKFVGLKKVEVCLTSFAHNSDANEIAMQMKQMGLRPAVLAELLAFKDLKPVIFSEGPVIALGTTYQYSSLSDLKVPYFHSVSRNFGTMDLLGGFGEICTFLAVVL